MPKSKHRKNRRPYRGKFNGTYGIPDPAELFMLLGGDTLGDDERDAAAQMLFREMTDQPAGYAVLKEHFGDDWPPQSANDLVALSRRVQEDNSGATP